VPRDTPATWTRASLDAACESLTCTLKKSLDKHAPKKPLAAKFNYWWNDECTEKKLLLKTAELLERRQPTSTTKLDLKTKRNNDKNAIYTAKKPSWKKLIKEVDLTPAMARVNKIMRASGSPAAKLGLVKDNLGILVKDKTETLQQMLAEHFPDSTPAEEINDQTESDVPIFVPATEWLTKERFRRAVNSYKKNKAPGPDESWAECLQSMDDMTVNYIIKLYSASIAQEYVPAKWRDVTVIFIPKLGKSDYTDKRAFRPISLMSALFKTLERLVLWHIEETNLTDRPMPESQYGFRKGKSTDQALSKAVNIIEKGLNQGEYVLGVFCDISGAFDNVLHSSITSAMSRRGIDSMIIKWTTF
jgi:hypothetical protein